MALIGAFLPWWGFDGSGIIYTRARRWTIWNPPRLNTQVPGAASVSWNFTISSVSVLVLVLVATALVVVGSITLLRRYLLGGLVLSAHAPVVYAVAINYVTMNTALLPSACLDQSAVSQFLEPQDLALLGDSRLDSMFSWQQYWF